MTRHTFDPEVNFAKVCGYGKQPEYIQNGRRFDAAHNYIGKVNDPEDTPESRAAAKDTVKERAARKIGRLDLTGYTASDKPDGIQEALNENAAAREAEENVE